MDNKSVEYVKKFIHFFDKISYIPPLCVSIIFFIFFLEILVNPFDRIHLFSTYLLGSIIGFLLYNYDKNYISPRIYNEEFDHIILDAMCWGIIGCIFHGTGIFILIKGFLILICKIDEDFLNTTDKKKENRINFSLKLYNSLNSISSLAGLVIILFVFYYLGISVILNVFNQLVIGNFQILFEPFYICLIISVIIILFDHSNDEFFNVSLDLNLKVGSKDLIKGIIGCCFYAASIFILFRGITLIFLPEHKKNISHMRSMIKEDGLVIYSNSIN
ncbi:MAG: hypothetical protein ACFE94_11740 [Candidatus Hodarchaeota archaeon]